jgi:lipoprotein-anchoring transpeptidase ErfK/SrfK
MSTTRTATWILAMTTAALLEGTAHAADGARAADAPVTRRIVVSLPDRRLALIENEEIVSIYPVAVGAAVSPSPAGTFNIVNRVANPTYYKPGKVVGPGSANPVGTRWIGLSAKGYGIHGTDNPKSIGYAKSHGCIRLRNQDVERLFERVRTGDVVELHAERTAETTRLFGIDGRDGTDRPSVERR